MMKQMISGAALAVAMLAAGGALAQSHSVVNKSNPPANQADSKAATDATPGLSANAERHDARHRAGNRPNGEWVPPVSKPTDDKGKMRNDIGAAQAGNEAKETMQVDPSESQVGPAERQALDVSATRK